MLFCICSAQASSIGCEIYAIPFFLAQASSIGCKIHEMCMSPLLPFEELESRMIVDVSQRSMGVKRG